MSVVDDERVVGFLCHRFFTKDSGKKKNPRLGKSCRGEEDKAVKGRGYVSGGPKTHLLQRRCSMRRTREKRTGRKTECSIGFVLEGVGYPTEIQATNTYHKRLPDCKRQIFRANGMVRSTCEEHAFFCTLYQERIIPTRWCQVVLP